MISFNLSTEVVATIDNIPYPRESILVATAIGLQLSSYIYLGMSQNVCIAGTAKSIIDTALAQVDIRVATHVTLITATIEVFSFSKFLII